jgi:hypothetical protein
MSDKVYNIIQWTIWSTVVIGSFGLLWFFIHLNNKLG